MPTINLLSAQIWRSRRLGLMLVAALLAASFSAAGLGGGLEQSWRAVRNSVLHRAASGDILLVAMDAKSLKTFAAWPWPRDLYARAIEKLNEGGVDTIAFDVDFSAPSSPDRDRALAQAIEASSATVILPTFRQRDLSSPGGFAENLPLEPFRRSAFLAAVNVHPDADGILRAYSYGERIDNVSRPSMGVMLAGRNGAVGGEFVLDQSIDAGSVPVLSFADVAQGRVDPATLRGKKVIIGATAIELGDRYALPQQGLQPGPLVQVLAAETLIVGRPFGRPVGWPGVVTALALLALISRMDLWKARAAALGAGALTILVSCSLAEAYGLVALDQMPALIIFVLTALLWGGADLLHALRLTERQEGRTGLPNALSLVEAVQSLPGYEIAAVRFSRLVETLSILSDEDQSRLMLSIAERLKGGDADRAIYLIGNESFCWIVEPQHSGVLDNHIAGLGAIFRSPMMIGNRQISLSPRIGLAAMDGDDPNAVLARAINAAREAESGDQLFVRDDRQSMESADRSQRLLGDLHPALAQGDIWVAYQPKMDIRTERIASAEALMRWQHPDLGAISPGEFIPLLEQERLMQAPTLFVLDRIFTDLKTWRAAGWTINVAINLSGTLLADALFVDQMETRFRAHPDLLSSLTVEVTESAAIGNGDIAIGILTGWRDQGVCISIDDYGTGQSTLTYLRSFPANEIKIDQSFIRDLVQSRNDQLLVNSTIVLAHELGMKVVAEGIETPECLDILRALQCDTAQGWLIGKPKPADAFFEEFCRDRAPQTPAIVQHG